MASSHPPSCYDDAAGDDDDVDLSQEEGPKAPARPANQKEACTFIIVVHASILLLVQLPIRLFVRRVPLSLSLSLSLSHPLSISQSYLPYETWFRRILYKCIKPTLAHRTPQ